MIKFIKNRFRFIFRHFLSIVFFGVLLGGTFAMAYSHEQVHKVINSNYGIDSNIIFANKDGKWYSWTLMTRTEPITPDQCNDSCKLAHNINEAISYVLIPAVLLLGFGIWMIIKIFEEIWIILNDLSKEDEIE